MSFSDDSAWENQTVAPAKAGVQAGARTRRSVDSGLCGNDEAEGGALTDGEMEEWICLLMGKGRSALKIAELTGRGYVGIRKAVKR